jgi:phytoene dehydrogenase-like protein
MAADAEKYERGARERCLSVPTLSDPTAVPERSHEEMVRQGQTAIDEQKARHEAVTQAFIPNKGVPPVSGDCIYDK